MIRFLRALFVAYFAVAAYGSVQAQTYPLFRPANGILKGQTTTYVTTSAAAADVTAIFSGSCSNLTYLRGDGTCATPPGTGGGTVDSVGLTAPSVFSVSGSPVTSTGVLALTFAAGQTQNQVLATPDGTTGVVGLRSLVAADLPAVPLATGVSGTLPVANGGTGVATITGPIKGNGTSAFSAAASADIVGLWSGTCSAGTVLRGDGSCAAVGTVTSVGLTVPSGFSVSGSPVTGSGTLGIIGTLNPAAGGTGVATITGPIKGNGTSAFSAAASADIIGLWTGLCSATTFLRGDGQCQTPAGSSVSGANPTASVGLTAVNGASGSFLRADGAPALSQAIVPTWTGVHTFNAAPVIATSINPDADAGADIGTSSLRFNSVFAATFCGGACSTNALVDNSSTVARFGNGSAWTEITLPKFTSILGGLNVTRSGSAVAVLDNTAASTGTSLGLYNNGVERGQVAAINGANAICVGGAVGDMCIRAESGAIRVSRNGGASSSTVCTADGVGCQAKTAYAFVQSNGAITGSNTTAVGISSVSNGSTGQYTVNFTGSFFATAPACTAAVNTSTLGAGVQVAAPSTASVAVVTYENSTVPAASNQAFNIVCTGPGG